MFSISSLRLYTLKSVLIGLGSISCVSVMQTPAEAATLNVPSSQYPTIQSAINAANRGDTIVVEAGRTYTENLVLRYKSGSGYVTIQSSALGSLPTAGNRVAPADASNMPTIRSTAAGATSPINTVSGSNPTGYYKLIGLNILRHNSTSQQQVLLRLGTEGTSQDTLAETPHNIIIDRCLIRGSDAGQTRRGIQLNVKDSQVINSYIDNFWETDTESHGILGYNGTNSVLIANNFIEGASINILIGGADPSAEEMMPTDITIEHNHFFKRLSWIGDGAKDIKNLLEFKLGIGLTIRNNIFENSWADAQDGRGIHFSNRGSASAPWSTVKNVVFEYNIVKNVGNGISFLVEDDFSTTVAQDNMAIRNNLVITEGDDNGGSGWALLFVAGQSDGNDYDIDHNTFIQKPGSNRFIDSDGGTDFITNLSVTNNIVAGDSGDIGRIACDGNAGETALNSLVDGAWTFSTNLVRRSSSGMPAGNFYVSSTSAIGFANPTAGDYRLSSGSPYKGRAPGNKDIGSDIVGLNSRTACVVSGRRSDCAATGSTAFDFDGDGRADVSLFRPSDGVWYLNRSRDGSTGVNFGISTDKVTPADFDGDGKADIAVFRPENNIWYVLNSSSWSLSVSYFGSVGDLPVPSDYDGDGRAEFAVWRPSDGTWYRANSTDGQFVASQFGVAGDRPALGDYDGDGRADLAVFRPSTGVWYLLRSSAGFAAFKFGIGGDVITPADFSGDGRTDIAVFRPSNGTWYRFDQSTGHMTVFQFGTAADLPVPADYDGDGKADLAVFRPATGLWYFQKSTEGYSTLRYGSIGDTPLAALSYANLPASAN
ncbi:MAG: VCBS repeat-containing protein [Acidobacteria bacterium]|nr:VCBS repeat-containing protein [Acidobacteriota bacterium]